MAKMFIYIGIALVVVGVLIHFLGGKMSWFGNLFGDVKGLKGLPFHKSDLSVKIVDLVDFVYGLNCLSAIVKYLLLDQYFDLF